MNGNGNFFQKTNILNCSIKFNKTKTKKDLFKIHSSLFYQFNSCFLKLQKLIPSDDVIIRQRLLTYENLEKMYNIPVITSKGEN